MLALKLSNGKKNIIHLIVGQQTQFQMDILGFTFLDAERYLESFEDKTLPLMMVLTRCEDEEYTLEKIMETTDPGSMTASGVIKATDGYVDMLTGMCETQRKQINEQVAEENNQANHQSEDNREFKEDYNKVGYNKPSDEIPDSLKSTPNNKPESKASDLIDKMKQFISKEMQRRANTNNTPKDTQTPSVKNEPKDVNITGSKGSNVPSFITDLKIQYTHGDPRGLFVVNSVCPLCNKKGVFLRSGLQALCADCLKIEYGRGNVKIETLATDDKNEFDNYLKKQLKMPIVETSTVGVMKKKSKTSTRKSSTNSKKSSSSDAND